MTIHQLAKSARRKAELMRERGSEYAGQQEGLARELESWAEAVGETRGRKKEVSR